ncbi:MAG TPA: hypothetical protein VGC41_25635, partial [Kofleriaceae bacterium]
MVLWSASVWAGHVKGTVLRDDGPGKLEVHIAIDGGAFATTTEAFDLDVEDGTHVLTFIGPEFAKHDQIVTVKGATKLDVSVESGKRIIGRVIDYNGEPIAGATVLAYTDIVDRSDPIETLWLQGAKTTTSSAAGFFKIDGIGDDDLPKLVAYTATDSSVVQLATRTS